MVATPWVGLRARVAKALKRRFSSLLLFPRRPLVFLTYKQARVFALSGSSTTFGENQTCTKSWLALPFPCGELALFWHRKTPLFLWEVPLFLQDLLYESAVFIYREIEGKGDAKRWPSTRCMFDSLWNIFSSPWVSLGNGRNTVSRVLFRRRELTEFCGKLDEFCEEHGESALAHK